MRLIIPIPPYYKQRVKRLSKGRRSPHFHRLMQLYVEKQHPGKNLRIIETQRDHVICEEETVTLNE